MRVVQDLVLLISVGGRDILAEELSVPGKATLGFLGHISDISGLDSQNLEADSEGLSRGVAVEKISEAGGGHTGEFGANLSDHVGASFAGLLLDVLGSLGDGLGQLGVGEEAHDVREVALGKNLLGGGRVVGDRSDSDNLSISDTGELELGGEGEPGVSREVSESEFVGVFIEVTAHGDSGNNIEVGFLGLGLLEGDVHVLGDTVVGSEVFVGP